MYITLGENTNRDLVETQSQKQLICVEVSIEDLENWNLENRRQLLKSENLQVSKDKTKYSKLSRVSCVVR